ncbi:aldo/keto reductase [Gorillibacterium massiliense]|uniref:aldo/keto reductase n=1 Tax=Gorillibacterium massiliense TaxID=1280390 RepID=UPI0004ACDE3E|nr:aldo/keto reductase [Gorillibacterium massiliense]
MKTRAYGQTGKSVSEIGFGAWQLGNSRDWEAMEDKAAITLVHEALERGINFFDSAPNYAGGKSEDLLGEALRGKREKAVISTKFGHTAEGKTDFSADKIRESLDQSLKRLKTDYVDSLLLHNPPFDHLDGKYGHYEVLEELKKEGKILAYGASVDSSKEMLELIRNTSVGVLEVMFNILYQETAEAFEMAREKGIALIIKVPLDSGWLSGKYNSASTFTGVRARWSPDVIRKRGALVEKIKGITGAELPLSISALRFILAHPEVTTVIPGIRNREQLADNVSASSGEMNEAVKKQLQDLWETEIRFADLGW